MITCPKCGSSNVRIVDKRIEQNLTPAQRESLATKHEAILSPDQWKKIVELIAKILVVVVDIFSLSKDEQKGKYLCCDDCHSITKL